MRSNLFSLRFTKLIDCFVRFCHFLQNSRFIIFTSRFYSYYSTDRRIIPRMLPRFWKKNFRFDKLSMTDKTMGKKSRRTRNTGSRSGGSNSSSNSNSNSGRSARLQQSKYGESSEAYRTVVMNASLGDIREYYVESFEGMKVATGTDFVFVTDNEVITDENAALEKMKFQMTHPFHLKMTEPIPQMRSVGNILKIFAVEAHGPHSFIYTRGYTGIGGKELLTYGVHRSMLKTLHQTFNGMYQEHLDGKPLGNGHTISSGNLSFLVTEPKTECEGMLLKTTKTLNCNRVYGLTAYDILIVQPIALKSGSDEPATREEILEGLADEREETLKGLMSKIWPDSEDFINTLDFSSGVPVANALPVNRSADGLDSISGAPALETFLRPVLPTDNVEPANFKRKDQIEELDSNSEVPTTTVKPIQRLRKLESCAWCHDSFEFQSRKNKLLKCTGCMRVYYCCVEHQKLHWKQHKKDCKRRSQNDSDVSKILAKMVDEVKLADMEEEQNA